MRRITHLPPASKDLILKISILKTMMYCGTLWGLYHQGWAIKSDEDSFIFPFWLNGVQAHRYAQKHWPNYVPKKIKPQDFQTALLPTLKRLNVTPALFSSSQCKFKLSTTQMSHFFFAQSQLNVM
ncbi:DUF2750 domain-containing protein [Acinetobacter soli]|uniref:DUF2750 domain-containing protein n=1 Tax=Acinetobacter soli TaxID=487316 RepID=UPI00243027DB|nr:DUF2750 domain-containing protein [Acinetobacter soli]